MFTSGGRVSSCDSLICEKLGGLIKSMKLAILEMHLQSKAEEKYPQKVEVGQMSDNLTLFS